MSREVPDIGPQLRALRERAELSQMDLAARAGVTLSSVFHLEQGRKHDPRLSTLIALAEGLGMTPGQLLDELLKPALKVKARPRGRPKKDGD